MNPEEDMAWGDIAEDNETELEEQGIKKKEEIRTLPNGKRVLVTQQIRVFPMRRTINKRIEERRKRWVKFGKCAGTTGPEPGITGVVEPVQLVLGEDERKNREREEQIKRGQKQVEDLLSMIERQADTGTVAPATDGTAIWKPRFKTEGAAKPTTSTQTPVRSSGVYVHPRFRDPSSNRADETSTIRVTNLSEDTTERDLADLFRHYGEISRIFLAKDKTTGKSKGFAFINYANRTDAQNAMDALNGKGHDYLILNIEWAKPSVN